VPSIPLGQQPVGILLLSQQERSSRRLTEAELDGLDGLRGRGALTAPKAASSPEAQCIL